MSESINSIADKYRIPAELLRRKAEEKLIVADTDRPLPDMTARILETMASGLSLPSGWLTAESFSSIYGVAQSNINALCVFLKEGADYEFKELPGRNGKLCKTRALAPRCVDRLKALDNICVYKKSPSTIRISLQKLLDYKQIFGQFREEILARMRESALPDCISEGDVWLSKKDAFRLLNSARVIFALGGNTSEAVEKARTEKEEYIKAIESCDNFCAMPGNLKKTFGERLHLSPAFLKLYGVSDEQR